MKKSMMLIAGLLLSFSALAEKPPVVSSSKPNVLFIAVDDLNHWVEPLGRNPQAKTPNIQRFADMGVTFVNAQCAVPACNPSRGAIMGGRRPWVSGLYMNKTGKWTDFQKSGEGLSAQFLKAGYYVAGAGKVYHGMNYHPEEWFEYLDDSPYSLNGPGVQKNDGYHNAKDPYEWMNQANNPEFDKVKKKLAAWLPKEEVAQLEPSRKKNSSKDKSEKKSKKKKKKSEAKPVRQEPKWKTR